MKLTVAVTAAGSTNAIAVIKAMRGQRDFEVEIVGLDVNPSSGIAGSAFCDAFQRVPPVVEEDAYVEAIRAVIADRRIDLLVPILDAELEAIALHRSRFDPRCLLLVSPHEAVARCNDKEATFRFFLDSGIPTLRSISVTHGVAPAEQLAANGLRFPLIAKPRRGYGSRGVYVIGCEDELVLLRRMHEPLLQEMAVGVEYSIDVFCGEGGRLLSAVPRARLDIRAGVCCKGRTECQPAMVELARRIAQGLGIFGPANIQCFKDGDEIQFTEVNPRFSSGLPLTVAAGVNTPLMALRLAAGLPAEVAMEFDIVTMCRYWEEVIRREC